MCQTPNLYSFLEIDVAEGRVENAKKALRHKDVPYVPVCTYRVRRTLLQYGLQMSTTNKESKNQRIVTYK